MIRRLNQTLVRGMLLIALAWPVAGWSQTADLMTFQGRLVDPMTKAPKPAGAYAMDFRIWTAQSGGTQLWQESQAGVPVAADGAFQVMLGGTAPLSATTLPAGGAWLETLVQGQAIGPRLRLTSLPLAQKARDAETLGGMASSSYAVDGDFAIAKEAFVMDYGAKGDGVNDDSGAIQSAINAVRATGGIVRFPPGRFRIKTKVQVTYNNISLIGAGRAVSILVADTTNTTILSLSGWRNNVEHLGFSGGAIAIDMPSGAVHKVFDCRIDDAQIGLVPGTDTIHYFISHVEFNRIRNIAVYLHHTGEIYLNDLTINDLPDSAFGILCDTWMSALYCERIWISGGKPVIMRHAMTTPNQPPAWNYFNNIHVRNGAGYGWNFDSGEGFVLVNCSAVGTRNGPGVIVGQKFKGELVLHGCRISENDEHGIYFASGNSTTYTRIEDCTIQGNSRKDPAGEYAGVWVESNVSHFIIEGNTFADPAGWFGTQQKYGIRLGMGCFDFIIANNLCSPHRSTGAGINNLSGTTGSRIVNQNID